MSDPTPAARSVADEFLLNNLIERRHPDRTDTPMRGSLMPGLARLIGPVGLVLFGVLLLIPDRATALLITDLGVGVLIALALGVHLAFWRRWRGKGSTTEGGT